MRCDGLRWDSTSNIRAVGGVTTRTASFSCARPSDAIHQLPEQKLMIAEDLYTISAVTQPTSTTGGLGFDIQWDAEFFIRSTTTPSPRRT